MREVITMENYSFEVELEIDDDSLQGFKTKVEKEIFLTKFTAVIAKKILLVADEQAVDAVDLLNEVENWLKVLGAENK